MKEAPGGATLTLIANLDYESSLKSYVCGFTLGTTVKVVIVQVVDDNDNYPLWVDPIYELGPFKEVLPTMFHDKFNFNDAMSNVERTGRGL